MQKKIVIIGGGFAGLYAARAIARAARSRVAITIVSRTNYFLFTPMLHEVATGGLGHHQVVESVREIVHGLPIDFYEATVQSVNLAKKEIATERGAISYDMLVLAQGATTNFFNTKGAAEHALVLKDLRDAIALRNMIIERFETAAHETDSAAREKLLSFVVVGGGATGVESAAEIAEFVNYTLVQYYKQGCLGTKPTVTLVQSGSELLPMFVPAIRTRAAKVLQKAGVRILFNTKVQEVSADGVTLAGGDMLSAATVLWTAGVKPNQIPTEDGSLPLHASERIITDEAFRVAGHTDVFAIGDGALVAGFGERGLPMLAQVAIAEARHLTQNIRRMFDGKAMLPFSYHSKGELVSLGRWEAVGSIFGIMVYGKLAWFLWRTVYLFKFISGSKRLRIAFDWTLQIFYPRDITRA